MVVTVVTMINLGRHSNARLAPHCHNTDLVSWDGRMRRMLTRSALPPSGCPFSQAFTRCCQLEPDNGASWNNIAAVCLSQKKYKEAFSALAESSKYLRQNWHTWDNYVQVRSSRARKPQRFLRSRHNMMMHLPSGRSS